MVFTSVVVVVDVACIAADAAEIFTSDARTRCSPFPISGIHRTYFAATDAAKLDRIP